MEMLKPVVDGFMYNSSLLLLPNRFGPMALEQMELLRRANNLRARWWIAPDPEGDPIAAYDTFQYQCEVAAGTWLWAYMFSAQTPGALSTDLLVSVTDSCTGVPLFNDFANCGVVNSNGNSKMLPVILTQPRVFLQPALVNVEIANRTSADRLCQLLLMFAEPCLVFQDMRKNP